ncbi:MAG: hydrogenase nickel incorporation protein HypB [Phycisphaerales bacterium]|nr:MAG: hydrogenase nickel incorporation protein HypB [Phycisphaerales bacterium]
MAIAVLKKSILAQNDRAAEQTRQLLNRHNVVAFNIMGGAGCGKTTLLERVIPVLKRDLRVAVLEGDLATTKDATRIDALGVPVVQLLTEGGCHLTATLVNEGLKNLALDELDLLLIENVGNPICPANFDLGEHERIAVLSVTEGDDKPAKYPFLFKIADLVVITKMDLIEVTDFDAEKATTDIHVLDPEKKVIRVAAIKTGADEVAEWLLTRCRALARLA